MEKDIAKYAKEKIEQDKRALSKQYDNTTKCHEFYNGDTMSYRDRIQFETPTKEKKKALVQFNKVKTPVDSVIGFMAQNRTQAKFSARVSDSEARDKYTRSMNALYNYVRENANADQIETDQDADMVIAGYGGIETDLSYMLGNASTLPNGEVIKMRLDPWRLGWDATARGKNILDAQRIWYWEEYDLKSAVDLFDEPEENFEKIGEDTDGSAYTYNPFGGVYDKIKAEDSVEWISKADDKIRVYNFQWFEYQNFYKAQNPMYTALAPEDAMYAKLKLDKIASEIKYDDYPEGVEPVDMFKFDPMEEVLLFDDALKSKLIAEFGGMIKPAKFKRKCFYTAVVSGGHLFKKFKSISQQGFSVKFKTGVYDEKNKIWVGMVNSMMEPAEYHNKTLTELMFTISSNSKGGVLVESDAVEDITEFEAKYAKTDGAVVVNPGAISGSKIQDKARPALPTGLESLLTLTDQAVTYNGVDPSFVGDISDAQQSGILFKRRIRQVISKFARYFDSIALYQKEDARLCADLISILVQNNEGELVRITGLEGQDEFMELSQDSLAAEYDVTIQEGGQTQEDKQETAIALNGIGDKVGMINPQGAMAFYAESLDYLPIDGDTKSRLKKAIQPQEGEIDPAYVKQLEMMVQQLQSEQTKAQLDIMKSQAALNNAKVPAEAAKLQKTQADTAKTLEDAAKSGLENDLMRSGKIEQVNVAI